MTTESVKDKAEIQGGFNFVRIMGLEAGPCADRYVSKIPCTGTPARWQEADAYMLRNEARTMQHIGKNTGVSIPEVLGFSDSLDNVLRTPYVVMRAVGGIPANFIRYDRDEDGKDDLEFA
jgi:hypothetical protein